MNLRKSMLVLVAALMLCSCATLHRKPNTDGTPTAPVTELEKVNFDNAQIAIHNRAVAESIIAINQAGFLEKPYFDSLSAAQIKISRIHQKLTPLLKNPVAADAPTLRALLAQIQQVTTDMVNASNVGITNEQSKASITNEIRAIATLGNSILSTLSIAGVLK